MITVLNRFDTARINARWAMVFEKKISDLKYNISKRKDPYPTLDDKAQMKEWQKEADYHREEQRRHNLAGMVCSQEYVTI